jgi:four helix bundle protein
MWWRLPFKKNASAHVQAFFFEREAPMTKNFRTYNTAVAFYRLTAALELPGHLKERLNRAASSIALNLAEGAGRNGRRDQTKFYNIAMGSLRECQAILELAGISNDGAVNLADSLGARLYRLIESRRG